jgi:hypothetical protein
MVYQIYNSTKSLVTFEDEEGPEFDPAKPIAKLPIKRKTPEKTMSRLK